MKLLAIVRSIDLTVAGGGIPINWQFLKGFHDCGVEVVVTTLEGTSFASPWWRSYSRPSVQNRAFSFAMSRGIRTNQTIAGSFYYRGWKKQLETIFAAEKEISVVFLIDAIPLAKKIPSWIRRSFGVPTIYYETDIQAIPKYNLKQRYSDYSECLDSALWRRSCNF
jgi:hypothetical protein